MLNGCCSRVLTVSGPNGSYFGPGVFRGCEIS